MSDEVTVDEKLHGKREGFFGMLKIRSLSEDEKRQAELRRQARKQHKKQLATDKKQAKELSQLERDRLLYTARLEQTKLALGELRRRRPAAAELIREFEGAINEAVVLAWDGRPEAALARLKKVHPTKAVETADELWSKANDNARKLSPGGMDAVRKMNALLADKDVPLPSGEIASFKREQTLCARPLLADKPSSDDVEKATTALLDLLQRIEQRISDADERLRDAERLHKDVRLELETAAPLTGPTPPLLTDRESAPMRLALASARTSISARDFDAATQTLQPLLTELKDIVQRIGPMRAQWLKAEPDLKTRLSAAAELAKSAQSPPARQGAIELRDSLQRLQAEGVGKVIGYPEALGLVTGASDSLDRLRQLEQDWLTFQGQPGGEEGGEGALLLAQQNIEQDFDAVNDALNRLHKAVQAQTQGKHKLVADGAFVERRDALRKEWDARLKTAHDEDSLDAFGMGVMLHGLRLAIDAVARDGKALATAIDEGRLARARTEFRVAQGLARDACEACVGVDAVQGSALLDELEQLVDEADAARSAEFYRLAVIRMKALRGRAQLQQQQSQDEVDQAQQALLQVLEPMAQQLAEIQQLAEKAKSGEKQAPRVALLETMRSQYDALRAMSKLTQLPLLESAQAEAEQFAQELTASVAAARGEGGAVLSFSEVRKRIANLKVELADKDYKLYCTSTQFTLSEKLKALEGELGTCSMPKLTEKLTALTDKVEKMEAQAAEAKKATKEFEKGRVAELLEQLSDKAFDDAPKFKASMKGRIKSLVADFQFEGGQDAARRKAVELEAEMTQLLKGEVDDRGVPRLLAQQEAAAEQAENARRVDQGKWEGESKVMKKRLEELSKINPNEIQALQDMLDSAQKSVERSKDYGGGRDQLQAIRNRLALVEANPQGLAITARNKLPQVNGRYRRAVEAFGQALSDVGQAVAKLPATDLDDNGKQQVSDQLSALRGLFNRSAFDAVVATMTDKGLSREKRSGARETSLREMRRLQSYLKGDFRLQTLAESPFGPDMHSVQSELMLSLLDLENNLLVSI